MNATSVAYPRPCTAASGVPRLMPHTAAECGARPFAAQMPTLPTPSSVHAPPFPLRAPHAPVPNCRCLKRQLHTARPNVRALLQRLVPSDATARHTTARHTTLVMQVCPLPAWAP